MALRIFYLKIMKKVTNIVMTTTPQTAPTMNANHEGGDEDEVGDLSCANSLYNLHNKTAYQRGRNAPELTRKLFVSINLLIP